jgi:hypothetical protein
MIYIALHLHSERLHVAGDLRLPGPMQRRRPITDDIFTAELMSKNSPTVDGDGRGGRDKLQYYDLSTGADRLSDRPSVAHRTFQAPVLFANHPRRPRIRSTTPLNDLPSKLCVMTNPGLSNGRKQASRGNVRLWHVRQERPGNPFPSGVVSVSRRSPSNPIYSQRARSGIKRENVTCGSESRQALGPRFDRVILDFWCCCCSSDNITR